MLRNKAWFHLPMEKGGGGIPGPDWRHQDVDIIRAYGSLLMILANRITSRDNREFPKCRAISGISSPEVLFQVIQ